MDDKVEVVISGAAGMFPECKNIPELEEALFSKLHLITDDKRKWKHDYPFSTHCGKAFSHEFFDPMFFNLPFTLPLAMDTLTKRCLEASIEAIIDAGVNPKFLRGTQTAVYATYDLSETELTMGTTAATRDLNVLMGSGRTFSAGRLSYALDLHGPSYTLQGGNGSLYHLIGHAKMQMEQGRIPAAVVVCANFIMTARALCNLDEMGFAAKDGKCRSFDEKAQGYAISDCCVALFLQRASDARRNWATVIGSEHIFFGDKPGSLLSLDVQLSKTMLQKLYSEWNIDPADVGYIEADGSGIREQDAQEADIISGVFCQNRKNPLLIGSLKSNMGHAQSAACGAGIVKALIALNRSRIPPNINLTSSIPEVTSGGIQVVTDATALHSNLVAVNAIGTVGHFGHILLKQNSKASSTMIIDEKLPQILLLSSRTEAGIEQILHQTEVTNITPEFAGLLNGVFWREVKNHMHRGYTIVSAKGINASRKVKRLEDRNRPVWWVFSGMGSQWNGMGTQLLRIPIFRDVIGRCDEILRPRGLDIQHILTTDDESIFDNILHSFVGITAVQIGLIEILRALELEPHGMVGHSLGELGCAYADGCLTLEQTILASYARGRASIETDLIKGMMAAVGMSGNDISTLLPPSIDVACQNSASSCTISGPAADVENFVTELKAKGIFAKSVNVGNIAYHSRYIQPASQLLLKYLKEIIPQNTRRSNKWVSTSVQEEDWDSNLARFNSPEYHTNNLLRPVLFESVIKQIPSNAVLIEIAPHGLLQAVLKRAVPKNTTNISLPHRSSPNGVQFLLEAIGKLYLEGCEPKVSALYPPIQYPVPCDTPSLQPFVTWDHSEIYKLPKFMQLGSKDVLSVSEKIISLEEFKSKIEEQNNANQPVSELSLLLFEVWKLFGAMKKTQYNQMPIMFENIRIHSKVNFFVEDPCELYMAIMRGNGDFTINQVVSKEEIKERRQETTEVGTSLIKGRIKIWETRENDDVPIKTKKADANSFEKFTCDSDESSSTKYEMRHCDSGICGTIKWTQDWLTFLHAMIEVNILANVGEMDHGAEPISFRTICLMPDKLERKNNGARIKFSIEPIMHQFGCEGVIMDGLKMKQKQKPTPHIESLGFVPFGKTSFDTQLAFIQACMRVIIESSMLTPNAMEKPSKMKLCIVQEDTIRGMEGLVENAIGSLSEDANVEVKVFSPTDQTDFSSDASLYISSDVEQILKLSRSGKIKHFYLLYEDPNEFKNLNKIMYDGSNRDKFIVLYEQEFDKKKLSFFKELNDELEPLIYHIDNNNWRSCVEDLNSNKTLQDKRVHLVFWELIDEDLHLVTREVLRICSIFHPRCFFVHDVVATVNSEYDRIWREQMKRDMILNVFQNGKWGIWLRNTVPKTDFIHQLSEKARNAGASSQIDMKYLSLDEIYSKYLEDQAIILGYSGIAASDAHKMGLAHRNEDVDDIILDPILQWTVPKHISLKDAASIPLAYLMANLIIRDEFCRQLGRKRVLVHNGNTPTGIACIAVALAEGHTVYTIVPDDVRREYVRRIFPQVHILDASCLTQAEFLVPFMLTTDGQGFEIIISDLPEEQFLASWNFVARGGFLVNLNESLPARCVPLPMNGFLKNVSVFSLSKRSISSLPPHRKQRLHGLVDEFLRSGKMIMIPHRSLSEDVALGQSFSGETELKSSNKLLLKILDFEAKHNGILSNVTKRSNISAPCISNGCYVILGANDKKLSTVIKWLLKHGAKNILLASSQNRNSLLRQVSDWAVNRGATLLFSGFTDPSLKGAQEILQKASKLGKLSAVFSVASAQNNEAVHNINQILLERNISAPVISIRDKNDQFLPNVINVVCDGNVNFSDVLGHALATQCNSTVYHVTEKSNTILQQNNSQTSVTKTHSDKFTDYLPCSLNELNNIGKLLSAKDHESDSGVYGKFFPTASLAPQKQLHRDVRPIFIIPAFCETQLRPLLAKLMYRCFVAHICSDVPSLNQLASHLLKSMMQIQKRGPYTIVAETWSGGVATTLSTLISDAGHEVSLFLIQGVPQKMTSLLPSQDLLGGCLVQHLFQEIKVDEELRSLDSTLEMLSNSVNKLYVQRAFRAILQTMVLLQSFNCATLHRDTLTLMELGCTCELKMSELKKMSEKTVRLVKSDSKTYKDMLKDSLISNTINDEALFSWQTY